MSTSMLVTALIGLLPVLIFLVALLYLDSYKMVELHVVVVVIIAGGLSAYAALYLNGWIMGGLDWEKDIYSWYAAPLVEEALKALIVIVLIQFNRIGFLVDAAILGFAAGAGFAVVENYHYWQQGITTNPGVWIVRGFGTAVMHGGATALFAIISQRLTERSLKFNPAWLLPGFILAVVLHSIWNHFFFNPVLSTIGTLLVLPPLLMVVYRKSARSMHDWLEVDFDEDAELLEELTSGEFTESRIGKYLLELRGSYKGTVIADMLCYLRLYTELALRAKGMLLAREGGLDVPIGERTEEKFQELKYLEKSIGKTGCLAMKPYLHMTRKDLWQIYLVD
jgi:RsiW-degrading membrane proteinase PrsW (M82 family)